MNRFKRMFYAFQGKGKAFTNSKYVIEYAFTSGGTDYYRFNDLFNMPWKRGLEYSHSFEELQMRCDKEYLLAHSKMVNDLFSGEKFSMEEAMKIKAANDQLRQRLNWIVVPEHAYKLASIVFFDASENPEVYDLKYNQEKIEKWKENDDVEAFFLRQPIRQLFPFLEKLEGNFPTYSRIISKADQGHWLNLYTKFSQPIEPEDTAKP